MREINSFVADTSKQVALQNMSFSFSLKTTLLWLRPSTCWQSGSSRWVGNEILLDQIHCVLFCLFFLMMTFLITCNFFLTAGVEPAQVQERVENHLKSLLIKHFDPQKADSIFTVEGEVRSPDRGVILQITTFLTS